MFLERRVHQKCGLPSVAEHIIYGVAGEETSIRICKQSHLAHQLSVGTKCSNAIRAATQTVILMINFEFRKHHLKSAIMI